MIESYHNGLNGISILFYGIKLMCNMQSTNMYQVTGYNSILKLSPFIFIQNVYNWKLEPCFKTSTTLPNLLHGMFKKKKL